MRPHEPYKPQNRKNILLITAVCIFSIAVGAMWFIKDAVGIDTGDMFILTGAALFVILMTVANVSRQNKIYRRAEELRIQREEMQTDNFTDASIFFDD